MTDKKLKIEYIAIEKLVPCPQNPRKNDTNVEALTKSMAAFGWTNPILARRQDLMVVAGHTRLKSAKAQGLKEVPVIFLDLDPADAKTYMIADNRLTEIVEWDNLKLGELFSELEEMDLDISLTGFNVDEISSYTRRRPEGQTDPDAIPEIVASITNPGDLWQLGDHRLLCGDATSQADVEKLMAGHKAAMIFCDPPYNVDYGSSKNPRHKIRKIENDQQSPDEWKQFCKSIFKMFKEYNAGDIYMWGAPSPDGMKMRLWLVEAGCHWSATIIWKKQQLVLSPANYQRMYEPCFYGWFDKSSFVADRKQTEVWEIDRPLNSKLHPTMKPVELCARGIQNSSKPNAHVLDLFLGSGSTLIACEKTCRKCYGMEIDPHYCDVIIKRWEDFTGKKAKRLSPDKKSAVKKKAAPKKKAVKKKLKKKVAS